LSKAVNIQILLLAFSINLCVTDTSSSNNTIIIIVVVVVACVLTLIGVVDIYYRSSIYKQQQE